MSTTNIDDLDKPDAIDENLINLDERPKNPLYFYMFLMATPILLFEYFFLLNKFNIFIEWARHV
ncbi:hypothetical protein V2I60_07970 [Pseudomonas viridiflava]|uniref:hypothetical protein n=1 Tax=Pseudomonas viridiflava TaxID=33069 RepID=UPI002EAC3BA6|nr:hypothetical protein [Pseudomonas viridiflava]